MSSVLAPASTPPEVSRKQSRLQGHRRLLATLGLLATVAGGMLTAPTTASAAPPSTCAASSSTSGVCPAPAPPQTTGPQHQGVTHQQWANAADAAQFWANHQIDWNHTVRRGNQQFNLMYQWNGHGWPVTNAGWYAFWDSRLANYYYVYTGQVFEDRAHILENHEVAAGVPRQDATGGATNSHWTEWDINYWNQPWGVPDRGAERIVRNWRTGRVYATFDHYKTFFYLGKY